MKAFGELLMIAVGVGVAIFLAAYLQFVQDMQDLSAPGFNMEQQ